MQAPQRHLSDRDLVARVDRELAADALTAAEAHLAECGSCAARAERLRTTALAVRMALRAEPEGQSPINRARLAHALMQEATQFKRWDTPWQRTTRALTPFVAVATVLVGAVLLVRQPSPSGLAAATSAQLSALPIARVTPGAVSTLTAAQLCAGERPSRVVTSTVAQQVLRDYRMEDVSEDEYELDALITPELGGTVAAGNLWPQRYIGGVWTAYVKDDIENYLRDQVCEGRMDLATAQHEIATDWIASYQRHFHRALPVQTAHARDDEPELILVRWP